MTIDPAAIVIVAAIGVLATVAVCVVAGQIAHHAGYRSGKARGIALARDAARERATREQTRHAPAVVDLPAVTAIIPRVDVDATHIIRMDPATTVILPAVKELP